MFIHILWLHDVNHRSLKIAPYTIFMLIMQDDFQNHTRNNSHCPMTSRHEFKVLFSSWKIKKNTRSHHSNALTAKVSGETKIKRWSWFEEILFSWEENPTNFNVWRVLRHPNQSENKLLKVTSPLSSGINNKHVMWENPPPAYSAISSVVWERDADK